MFDQIPYHYIIFFFFQREQIYFASGTVQLSESKNWSIRFDIQTFIIFIILRRRFVLLNDTAYNKSALMTKMRYL